MATASGVRHLRIRIECPVARPKGVAAELTGAADKYTRTAIGMASVCAHRRRRRMIMILSAT